MSLSLGKKPMWPPREPAKSHTVMTGSFPPLSSPRSLRVGVVSQGDERYICKLFAEKVKEHQLQSWGSPGRGALVEYQLGHGGSCLLGTEQLKLYC